MADYASVFGETLYSKNGPVPVSELNGKYVGVYFSAHWCGPCRQFTPVLRKIYLNLKKSNTNFEIVFASHDSDQKGFDEYYGTMPWLAVDYKNQEIIQQLDGLFDVSGIPRFVMLSPEGVLNPDAKDDVLANENGFPWKESTVKELITSSLKKGEEDVDASALDDKYFGLYFSAHWCGPCKKFTPVLIDVYNKLKEEQKNFEVVFCSLDNDPEQYKEYYGSMPWMSIGYENPATTKLKKILGVEGIPTLVICDTNGVPVVGDGRNAVESSGAEGFPWMPNSVKNLNEEPDDINAMACLVAFLEDAATDVKESTIAALGEVADEIKTAVSIFYVDASGDVSQQIRGMINATESPLLAIVNIPDNGGYYLDDKHDLSASGIRAFVQSYASGALERKQMSA